MHTPLDLLPPLLRGVRFTIELLIASALLGFVMAMIGGLGRISRNMAVRMLAGIYVEVFRGTSLIVQLFWAYFALPLLGINLTGFTAATLAMGLNVGAYGSEVVRGAILAVPKSQIEAAIALNMTTAQRIFRVVIPQAWVRILPPFGNLTIELLKSTSLASLIAIPEMTYEGTSLQVSVGRTSEIYFLLLILYFVLAYPLTLGIRGLEKRRRWA